MKKLISFALAAVLCLASMASLAFVVSPGTGNTTLTDAFAVTGFKCTDATVTTQGVRIYSNLVDASEKDYNVNELMYFALTISIANPARTLAHTSAVGNEYTIIVSSDTVDLSMNTMTDVVLTHPHDSTYANLVSTENGIVKANASEALVYDKDSNSLTFKVNVHNDNPTKANVNVGNEAFNLAIDEAGTAREANYVIGFTGINRAAENGAIVAKVSPTEFKFKDNTLTVVQNGRTYQIDKVEATWPAASNTSIWPASVAESLSTVGYRISLVAADGTATEIVTLDTEVTNAEGYGVSLGLAKAGRLIARNTVGSGYVYADNGAAVFTPAEQAAFETMLADFGFSLNYNYKLQDKNFEQATTYQATFTVEYNVEDDEADVEEPTDDLPLEEDEDEIPVDEEDDTDVEEVPPTGDGTTPAALCIALAAVCAAALAAALKRTRKEGR
ncbi:MAG: hypothetical protein ACOYIR_00710 [Christensenellales bacterium]|jgi:hypothetical protein